MVVLGMTPRQYVREKVKTSNSNMYKCNTQDGQLVPMASAGVSDELRRKSLPPRCFPDVEKRLFEGSAPADRSRESPRYGSP